MAEKGRSPAKPEKMEEKTGKVKPQNPQKLPSGVKKLFEIAQTGSAKELKAAFVKLPKEIVTELVWGLDWESETGLAVLGKMKKGGRAALKCCNDICCCRPFDIRWIRKCLDDPECVEALRELLRCLCGCCCCDFCWPPRLFCRCSCSVLVYPKDGVANSYVRTRKLRFSGANITANASNEAVITFPPGAGGNVDWADVQNTPASYAPSAHDIGGTGPHTGTLDNSQIPTTIHGRNIAADGANMDTLTSGAEIDLHSHATKAHDIGGTGPHTGTLDNSQIPTTIHGRNIAADGANMDTLTSNTEIDLHSHATKAHDIGGTGPHTGTLDNSQIPTTIHGRNIAADGANMDILTSNTEIDLHSHATKAHDIGGTGPHTGTLDNSQIPTTIHGRDIAADGANMDILTSNTEIDLHSHATKAHDIGGTGPHTGTLDNSQIPTTIHGRDIAADGANMDTLTSGDNITLHTHPKITYREELSIPEHPGSAPIRVTFTNEWPDVNTTDVIVVASGYIEETDTTLTPLYITAKSVDKPATNFRLNLTVKDSDGNTYDPGDLMLWPMNRKLHFAVHVFA